MKPLLPLTVAVTLALYGSVGLAKTVTTAQVLPQTMDVLRHAVSMQTVAGHGQVPAFAAYLADKLKAGGFAARMSRSSRSARRPPWWRATGARARASRSTCPGTWTWWLPTARTGRAIRSPWLRKMAICTDAAWPT